VARAFSLLFLSTGTVREHLDHIYVKLGVHTRTAAAAILLRPKPPSS
jgi:DNA-binding NarL/FixJ family response regulator